MLDSSIFSQSQTETSAQPQQVMLQINQPSKKKGGLSISVSSKKVKQTQVKHVRHVQHTGDADLLQLYKKGDDFAVVQEVKVPGEFGDLSQMLSSPSSEAFKTSTVQKSFGTTTSTSLESIPGNHHKSTQQVETHRTVTVVRNVTTSSEQQQRIIDLMSGPAEDVQSFGDSQPSGGQQEPLVDLMSSPPVEYFSSSRILQPSMSPPMSPVSPTMTSGDPPLIPDLPGDSTPMNVQQTMNLSSDGDGLTWKQEMDMQGGGQLTTQEKDGQVSQVNVLPSISLKN